MLGGDPASAWHVFARYTDAGRRNRSQRIFRSGFSAMKIKYFQQTDTLYIELRDAEVAETRDLDENTQNDDDDKGILCAITIEHASQRTDLSNLSFNQVAA